MYGDSLMNDNLLSNLSYSSFPPRYLGLHATGTQAVFIILFFIFIFFFYLRHSVLMIRYTVLAPYLEAF